MSIDAEEIVNKIEELIRLIKEDEPSHEHIGNTLSIMETKKELTELIDKVIEGY